MDKRQQQLILDLAKRLKNEPKSKSESIKKLTSIGLFTTKNNKNSRYPNLERVLTHA
jgi:Mn-dependent DtxR family transcriptional regulator